MAGETEGFVKIVADKKYDEVLGVHMIGPRSTELVAEATLALAARVDGRGAHSHDSRAPDDGRGGGRSGARRPRRRDSPLESSISDPQVIRRPDNRSRQIRVRNYGYRRRDAADGRVDRRRHDRPLDQEGRRPGRARRAALRDLDRQGGRGDSVAGRRRASPRSAPRKARRFRSTASSR